MVASFQNPLLRGSLVMVIGTNLYSAGQFLYHAIALRTLGEFYYGDLAAVISILSIVGVLQLAFNLTIVKFTAGHKEKSQLQNFSAWINWWSILIGLCLAGVLLFSSPFLAAFLKLHQPASAYLLPFIVGVVTVVGSNRALLQGLLRFNELVLSMMVEIILKIILTVVLVYLSYAVFGAITALLVAALGSYLLTRIFLRDVLDKKRQQLPDVGSFIRFSMPVFIQGAALTSMYSTDILIVKHFFPSNEAGIYASVAALGRIAFFVSTPVAAVMFPVVVRRHAESRPYRSVFLLSAVVTTILSVFTVSLFKFAPQLFLTLFSGHALTESVGLLWWFASFAGLLSLSSLFVQYFLSVGKTGIVWIFVIAALAQALTIWFVHPDLLRVIQISLSVTALLAAALFIYFPYHDHK